MSRRQYAGGSAQTTITGSVASSGAVTIAIASSTGWPDGSVGPFAVVVDPGTANEEKILVTSRSGLNLTVGSPGRGYDGTSATAHSSGATIYLTVTAVDLDEANSHVNATASAHAATAISNTPAGSIAATTVQAALNELDTEKAAASHTHTASAVTDFAEVVRDTIGTALVAGTAIDLTVNDAGDTITIDVDPTEVASGTWTADQLADSTRVLVSRLASQSITSSTLTDILWDAETDADGFINTGSPAATFTVPAGKGGFYAMQCVVQMESGTTSLIILAIVNGSTYVLTAPVSYAAVAPNIPGACNFLLSAGDTVKFQVRHTTGSSKNITGSAQLLRVGK